MVDRILVTGVNGFVGKHLVRELHSRSCQVVGIGYEQFAHPEIADLLHEYIACDLTNQEAVAKIRLSDIDAIISLAGLARVGPSFSDPEFYKHVNVAVLTILCEHVVRQGLKPRIVAISSGAVYNPDQPMPLTENSQTALTSPYAESKLAMESAALGLRENGLDCVVARPFNHIGPGQEGGFLVPDLFQKIVAVSSSGNTLKVGDLATRRDYTDVRDVVRAYADLAVAPRLNDFIYNVCSGKSIDGNNILTLLMEELGTKDLTIYPDPDLIRPNDPRELYGSNERIRMATGWQPAIAIEQTIQDFVAAAKS